MKTVHPSRLLRNALLADAVASGAVALLHLLLNRMLSERLGLDSRLLLYTGMFLLGYANLLLVLAYTDRIWVSLLRVIIAGNAAWAAGCLLLIVEGVLAQGAAAPLAAAFLGMQALAVLAFAGLEYAGLRASSGMRPRAALRA
ncbi:hypothetical protein [Noviherbaspirillum suwonense]|uniref:Uncharacterized protein n=1 Tax=Noviherbaspirillum suwonense TaxID=1224511 RepID=A0ABY1PVU4_9BURK|nr:hypothetical protein [Noviherbaspirillum suwonense]SMP49204.1 hypothetical protein SAMN06295970_102216 [Noviherbaspirillum suwonense]